MRCVCSVSTRGVLSADGRASGRVEGTSTVMPVVIRGDYDRARTRAGAARGARTITAEVPVIGGSIETLARQMVGQMVIRDRDEVLRRLTDTAECGSVDLDIDDPRPGPSVPSSSCGLARVQLARDRHPQPMQLVRSSRSRVSCSMRRSRSACQRLDSRASRCGWGAAVREGGQCVPDLGERYPDFLGQPDERDPAQHVALVATLVAAGPAARDEALAFVEVQRRDRHPAALRQLSGREFPGVPIRHFHSVHPSRAPTSTILEDWGVGCRPARAGLPFTHERAGAGETGVDTEVARCARCCCTVPATNCAD